MALGAIAGVFDYQQGDEMSILTHDEAKRLSQSSTDPLEVIRNVEAAVIIKLAGSQNAPKDEIRLIWKPKCDALRQQLEAAQAENAQSRIDFKEMVIERNAELARLAEIERQEPVGYLYDWVHSSATGRDDETYTGFTKDKAHAEKHDNAIAIYAAAGASPVEPSESAEHRDELAKRKPEPASETVGGLAKAVKAARGGDAPPAPMRGFA